MISFDISDIMLVLRWMGLCKKKKNQQHGIGVSIRRSDRARWEFPTSDFELKNINKNRIMRY